MTADGSPPRPAPPSEEELAAVLTALGVGSGPTAAADPADAFLAWRHRRLTVLGYTRRRPGPRS